MNDDERRIFEDALLKWGANAQIQVAIEEFAELIVELAKIDRRVNGSNSETVLNELADASIMIDQMRIVFEDVGADFLSKRYRKIQRLKERLALNQKV